MNDNSYENYSDSAVISEIGKFIKSRRIEQNLTQEEVAHKAAISRSTLSLAERGEKITLGNLVKIIRVLDAMYVFNHFKEVKQISPMQLTKEEEKKRKRASRKQPPQIKNGIIEW